MHSEKCFEEWLSADEAVRTLRKLCGLWLDQKQSSYKLEWGIGAGTQKNSAWSKGSKDEEPTCLDVSTTRPSGATKTTEALIHIEWWGELGRVVWGRGGPKRQYTIASLDSKKLVWQRAGSAPFEWHRRDEARQDRSTGQARPSKAKSLNAEQEPHKEDGNSAEALGGTTSCELKAETGGTPQGDGTTTCELKAIPPWRKKIQTERSAHAQDEPNGAEAGKMLLAVLKNSDVSADDREADVTAAEAETSAKLRLPKRVPKTSKRHAADTSKDFASEVRRDPEDDNVYTFDELSNYYVAQKYTAAKIEAYWNDICIPVTPRPKAGTNVKESDSELGCVSQPEHGRVGEHEEEVLQETVAYDTGSDCSEFLPGVQPDEEVAAPQASGSGVPSTNISHADAHELPHTVQQSIQQRHQPIEGGSSVGSSAKWQAMMMSQQVGVSNLLLPTIQWASPMPQIHPGCEIKPLDVRSVVEQVEYWFSDSNLAKSAHMRSLMNAEGWVSIHELQNFPRMLELGVDHFALRQVMVQSSELEIDGTALYVRIRDGERRMKWLLYLSAPAPVAQPMQMFY